MKKERYIRFERKEQNYRLLIKYKESISNKNWRDGCRNGIFGYKQTFNKCMLNILKRKYKMG